MIGQILSEAENCKSINTSCPCKILRDFVNVIGGEEKFQELYEKGLLPDNIEKIYNSKLKK